MTLLTKVKNPGVNGLRHLKNGVVTVAESAKHKAKRILGDAGMRTKLQEWIDLVDNPSVSPEKAIAGLEDEISKAERTAAYMIGTERDLLGQLEDAAFLSGELGLRAAQAAEEGRDYVARQMLEEKAHYDAVIAEVRIRYQDARERVQGVVQKLYDMKEQLYGLKKRQAVRQK